MPTAVHYIIIFFKNINIPILLLFYKSMCDLCVNVKQQQNQIYQIKAFDITFKENNQD